MVLAVVRSKTLLNQAPYATAEDGLMAESVHQDEIIGSKNQLEAVMAGMGKRKPEFENYRDETK